MSLSRTSEIATGIYWVGGSGQDGGLHCNPYLLVDDDEAVLIDPGSVLDFEYVFENVCGIVPLEKVKYVILHHQGERILLCVNGNNNPKKEMTIYAKNAKCQQRSPGQDSGQRLSNCRRHPGDDQGTI